MFKEITIHAAFDAFGPASSPLKRRACPKTYRITRMAGRTAYDGSTLREMFREGALWLEKNARVVDALNVFPVPDGDTGTNMLLTMRSTLEEAAKCPSTTVGEVGCRVWSRNP